MVVYEEKFTPNETYTSIGLSYETKLQSIPFSTK